MNELLQGEIVSKDIVMLRHLDICLVKTNFCLGKSFSIFEVTNVEWSALTPQQT